MAASPMPELLAGYDEEKLAADLSSLVAVDPEATILWVNDAWRRFAFENEGAEVVERFGPGRSYLDGIDPMLRGYFKTAFDNALVTGESFELDYECSSARTFRLFHMLVLPIRQEGLLIVHSPLIERPHHRAGELENDPLYRQPSGIIVQCANCRRVRRTGAPVWDWVPAWVENVPERTSHGICSFCRSHYWGAPRRRAKREPSG